MVNSSLRSTWWLLRLQLREAKLHFIWSIVKSIYDGLSGVLTVYLGAKFITSFTAAALSHSKATDAYFWLSMLFVNNLLRIAIGAANNILNRALIFKMENLMNSLLMHKMYELSQEQYDNQDFNTKLKRAHDGLNSTWGLMFSVSNSVSSVISLIASLGTIVIVSPLIGIGISLLIIPASLFRIYQNKAYDDVNRKVEPFDRIAYRSRWFLIDANMMPEVRITNAFKQIFKSWSENSKKSQKLSRDADKRLLPLEMGIDIIEPAVEFGATVYYLNKLLAGTLSLDKFIFLRGLLEQANRSSWSIVSTFKQLHETSLDMQYFIEVYNTKPVIPNGTIRVHSPLTIEFQNVDFSYPHTKTLALDDVSFIIAPGSKLALVGENGAGKSTLLKLLLRQYLPKNGSILVNGVNIKDVEQRSYYRALSNLSQEFLLVEHLTIEENLRLGLDYDATHKEIKEACQLVGAHEFISKLPHKYKQRLDPSFDDGTGLSGGQKQRIGVARALLRSGDILILDEPTSAIDAKAEYMIFNNIYKNHAQKTTLIVSHRFSTVRKADKIIVMEQGKITEYGSHEELLAYGKLYKEMFEAQAEGYQ